MTDEKKPPQEVVDVAAQIVIDLDSSGKIQVRTTCFGLPDCYLEPISDAHLVRLDLPFLISELRAQLRLGRRLTVGESDSVKAGCLELAKNSLLVAETNLRVLQLARISGHP